MINWRRKKEIYVFSTIPYIEYIYKDVYKHFIITIQGTFPPCNMSMLFKLKYFIIYFNAQYEKLNNICSKS